MHFFQNSCTELAKIKNLHFTICLKVFPSSGRVALPPAFAQIEGRGAVVHHTATRSHLHHNFASQESHIESQLRLHPSFVVHLHLHLSFVFS